MISIINISILDLAEVKIVLSKDCDDLKNIEVKINYGYFRNKTITNHSSI